MRFALRHVTACPRHGLRLDDACACGRPRRIFERHSTWGCPACGMEASDQPRVVADPRETLIARALLEPASCDRRLVPPAFVEETRSARAAVVERLGILSGLERNDAPSTSRHNVSAKFVEAADRTRRLADDRAVVIAAADLLSDWHEGYAALVARLVDRHGDPNAAKALLRRFASKAGRLALRLFVDHDRRLIHFAEAARAAALNAAVGYVPEEELVLRRSTYFEEMPCTPSAVVSTPRTDADFVSAREFGRRLHVGDIFHLEAWFEAGLIGTVRHEDGTVLVRRADFDHLLRRVATLPDGGGDSADYIPSAILNNKRGAYYRQCFMIEDVLRGGIRSRAAADGSEGMGGRVLHRGDFDRRRALCRTAIQVIADDFVGYPAYLPALWGIKAPAKAAVEKLIEAARIRVQAPKGGRSRTLISIRDLIRVVQEDGGRLIIDTDPTAIAAAASGEWRSIVVGDLCAG